MSTLDLPNGLIPYGPHTNCTAEICPTEASVYGYRPSIAFNATFVALFSASIMVHAVQLARYRAYFFSLAMISGCVVEIIGYAGRLWLHQNPFSFSAFMANISTYSRSVACCFADRSSLYHNCPGILLWSYLRYSWRSGENPRTTIRAPLSAGLLLDVHSLRRRLTDHAGDRWIKIFAFNRRR